VHQPVSQLSLSSEDEEVDDEDEDDDEDVIGVTTMTGGGGLSSASKIPGMGTMEFGMGYETIENG